MMPSHPSNEDLFAYRDGELVGERRSLVEAHVLSCSACQNRIDDTSDAEAMLRQGLQDPSDAYFDRLSGSVMARVTGAAPAGATGPSVAAGTPAAPSRGRDRESKGVRAAEPPRAGRRPSLDESPRGRAPGLPWPAVLSAVSAAAAVVVVVVMLAQRQDVWRRAPAPEVVGLPERARTEPPATEQDATPDEAAPPPEAAPLEESAKEQGEGAGKFEAKRQDAIAPGGEARLATPPPAGAVTDLGAAREEQVRTQSAAEALPDASLQKTAENAAERVAALRAKADAAASSAAPSPGPGFSEVAARYGLPLLYDPARVPGSALLRAEPELRLLYQTGRAGDDSARVRLYLAEAARERAAGSLDAEAFDAIVHHYRRAVALARDGETVRMARKRLEDFVSRNAPSE